MPTFKTRKKNTEISPGGNVSKKTGFTLIEILVTVVILAGLAAVSIPGFTKTISKGSAKQAIAYLRTIRTAEKMYYAKWGVYVPSAGFAAIKTNIGADVRAKDYTFAVTTPTATTFTATATKSAGNTLSLTQDGAWSSTGNQAQYQPTS